MKLSSKKQKLNWQYLWTFLVRVLNYLWIAVLLPCFFASVVYCLLFFNYATKRFQQSYNIWYLFCIVSVYNTWYRWHAVCTVYICHCDSLLPHGELPYPSGNKYHLYLIAHYHDIHFAGGFWFYSRLERVPVILLGLKFLKVEYGGSEFREG